MQTNNMIGRIKFIDWLFHLVIAWLVMGIGTVIECLNNQLIDWLKYTRSYLVLKECIKLEPQNTTLYMLAAKLCYEHLNLVGCCDVFNVN